MISGYSVGEMMRFVPHNSSIWQFIAMILAALVLLGPIYQAQAASITRVVVETVGNQERITLKTSEPLKHKSVLLLANPDRFVIDFPLLSSAQVSLPASSGAGLVKAARFGQFNPETSRLVFDLAVPARFISAHSQEYNAYIITLARKNAAAINNTAVAGTPAQSTGKTYDAVQDEKPLIVIDAGHGGQDPGATGASGVQEKKITLELALLLRQAFLKTGRYRVALTREDDRFIILGDRINIARKLHADMFISLHADSNPRKDAQGFSIYTISETASDAEAEALAARENAVDDLSGMDLGNVDKDVADILIDLAARETKSKSSELADIIVDALHPKIVKLPSTHRYAGFRVLKAPDIPSVLVELGFLTNARDEALLQSREYRDLVTQSIVRGVDAYYVSVKRR